MLPSRHHRSSEELKNPDMKTHVQSLKFPMLMTAFVAAWHPLQAAPVIPVAWKQSNSFSNLRLASNLSNANGMDPTGAFLYNLNATPVFGTGINEPSSANGVAWLTTSKPNAAGLSAAAASGQVWIVADLGAVYRLDSIRVWNFQWQNSPTSNLSNRGVSQFDVLLRMADEDTDTGEAGGVPINLDHPADDVSIADDAVFMAGDLKPWQEVLIDQPLAQAPNNDSYAGESYDLSGSSARFLAIRVDSYHGGAGIGLGKVRIEGTLLTDATPPVVTALNPLDDAVNLSLNANLQADFSEPVQAGTGHITLRKVSDNSIVERFETATSPRVTFTVNRVSIDPTADLAAGTGYYVQIDSTAVRDAAGNFFAGLGMTDPTAWNFTTDGKGPVMTGFSPQAPALADPGSRLLIQFDEAIIPGTGTVTVHRFSDSGVVETIDIGAPGAVSQGGQVMAISRSVPLTPGMRYYVNATAGLVRDLSGLPSAAVTDKVTWSFTAATALPLVVENFSSSPATLNGTEADRFAPAIAAAGGSSMWVAAETHLANGAVSGGQTASYLSLGSYINETKGTNAGRFDLSMTISEVAGTWISLGFAAESAPSTQRNFTNTGLGGGTTIGTGTILYRAQNFAIEPGELDMFGGPRNANAVDGPGPNAGFRTLTVSLDLTPVGGYDGVFNFGTVTWSDSVLGPIGTYTWSEPVDFSSILITQTASSGMVSGLTLHQILPSGNSYADWIGGFHVGGLTGLQDDFDHDGLANAVENLLGTNPAVFSSGLAAQTAGPASLVVRHTLSTNPASDLRGSYEWSADLKSWHASGMAAGGTTVTFGLPTVVTPGSPNLIEVTANVTGAPVEKVFVRFKAFRD
jgi:hypothetical protein